MICKFKKAFSKLSGFFLITFSIFLAGIGHSGKVNAQNYAGLGADLAGAGTFLWTNPTNIYSNTLYATTQSMTASTGVSHYLRASNFGFSVPAGTSITGIIVCIDKKASGSGVKDNIVSLVNGSGAIVGSNYANTTAWGTSDAVSTYGGSTDTWGASLTYNDINNSNFGVVISAKNTNASNARTASVDYITITVIYSGSSCIPTGNGIGTDGITNVTFNTINNPTTATNGYQNYFGSISTSVYKGSAYNLSVSVNTAGNYTNKQKAWIDWDQNGDFSVSEEYDLGLATNVANGLSSLCPLPITVPAGAATGTTRMRVSSKYSTYATPCEISVDGEFEDYAIIVQASAPPTVTNLNPSSGCVGSTLTITGTNFTGATAVKIGGTDVTSYTVNSSTQITATVGSGTTGTVSVTTSDGTGTSASTFTVNATPSLPGTITSNSPQCVGTGITFTQGSCSSGTCYWVSSATGTETTNSAATYTTATTAGTYNVWVRAYNGSCWSSAVTSSGTVNALPSITGQPGNQTVSAGAGTATFTVSATGGSLTYQWQESTNGGSSWSNISNGGVYSGATAASLVITNPPIGMNAYKYRCTVSGCSPSATSDGNATLSVTACIPTASNNTYYITGFSTTGGSTNITNTGTTFGTTSMGYSNYSAQSVTQQANSSVNFTINTYNGSYTYGIAVWVDWNNNGAFESGERMYNSGAYVTTVMSSFTVPAGTPSGSYRMRVMADYNSQNPSPCSFASTPSGEAEDYTFTVSAPPTCYTPSGVGATNITATTATLNWSAASPAPSNGYQWEVRTSGTPGSGGATSSGSVGAGVTTASVTGLSASTTYYAYVRSYCGGSDYSSWTSAYTFNTPCTNVTLTYTNGFNSTSIPACWTQQYVSGTCNLSFTASGTNPTLSSPYEGTQMVFWNCYAYLSGNQTRLVSPPVTTIGTSDVVVEFQWYNSSAYPALDDRVQVQYSTDGTTWTNAGSAISRYNATAGWIKKQVILPAGAGNQSTVYVGFLFISEYGNGCYMDAVTIRPFYKPNCAVISLPSDGATNAWPGSLVWTAPTVDGTHDAATGYKVYFGTNNPPSNIENGTTQTGTSYSIASLNVSTTYYWKIVAYNSTGDAVSCSQWSFTTPAVVPTITFTVGTGTETSTHYNNIQRAYDHCTTSNPYIIEILSTYTGTSAPCSEVYPIDLSTVGTVSKRSAVNNLIIRPATGASFTFTNSASEPVFKFNGAKYVTIDGRPGGTGTTHGITIVNSNTGNSNHPWAVWFNNDACYNTIQYCDLKAGSTSLTNAVVVISEPNTTGNNYNNILYNNISNNTATYPENGVQCVSYGVANTNNNISYNNIFNFYKFYGGIFISDNCNGFTIRGNNLYQTVSRTPTSGVGHYGMYIKGDNHTICQNKIGGSSADCGGGAWTFNAAPYDSYFTGICLTGSSSSTSRVDSNKVSNIVFNTQKWTSGSPLNATRRNSASAAEGAFIGILIDQGSASVMYNSVGGNNAGNITVINCNSSSSAGDGTEAHGIDTYSDNGTVTISRNTICGIHCYASNTNDNYNARVMGIVSGAGTTNGPTYNITYNTIGSLTLDNALLAGNTGGTNNGDFHVIGIYNESGIGGSKAAIARVYIKGNVVANLCANGNGDDGYVNGIHNCAGTLCEIDSNTVCMLRCKQATSVEPEATTTIEKRCVIGIAADNDGGFLDHFWVNRNYVYDLKSTYTGSNKVDVIGIYFRSAVFPVTGRVYRNRIWSLNASSSNYGSLLEGLWTYGQNAITYNNFITLGSDISGAGSTCPTGSPAWTPGYEIRGINNVYGKDEYYYNSVCIIGNVSGGSNTFAYKFTNTVAEGTMRIFKDNIFMNMRNNTGGVAKHYAYSINDQETNSSFSSDYNIFYTPGTGGVLFQHDGADVTTLTDWTTATTMDANSIATGSSASNPLFVAPTACTPDLNITNTSSPAYGHGTTSGIPPYILDDIFGVPRAGSNDIGAVVVGGTLPIELFSFTAEKYTAGKALLEWVTLTETNNDFFTAERSTDGVTFTEIETIKGAGNSNEPLKYRIFDGDPVNGINYYRLKQTDFDGNYSYSQIVPLNFSDEEFSAIIYPNPFSDCLNIDFDGELGDDTILSVFDITGKLITEKYLSGVGSHVNIQFGHDLPDGFYIIKIHNSSKMRYYKVIKRKE